MKYIATQNIITCINKIQEKIEPNALTPANTTKVKTIDKLKTKRILLAKKSIRLHQRTTNGHLPYNQ